MTVPNPISAPLSDGAQAAWLRLASEEILLLLQGPQLQVVDCNPAALDTLGYGRAQLLGMAIGELECALSDMFFWDEMQGRELARDVESALRCGDGSVLVVHKTVRKLNATPLQYSLRAVPAAQQNRIEEELAQMGSRLRATLEATSEGILLLDHEGHVVNMNQQFAEMWQLPQELLQRQDDAAIVEHLHQQCLRGEPIVPESALAKIDEHGGVGQETVYLRDGRVIECGVRSATAAMEMLGRVYSYRDVTERHRNQQDLIAARDEAKRASRAKSEFLAMMSHEIRTPMNGVLGVAELLSRTTLDEEQAEFVRVIRSSGETLMAILNDILDFSKIEAGKLELEKTPFSLNALLQDVVALFQQRQAQGGPLLIVQAQPGTPQTLLGDPTRLRQILLNLVGNAFKFTQQGSITVQVAPMAQACAQGEAVLRFSVHDTGIGLTQEAMGRLFQSFEQADGSTTRKFGGTGLGLAICKRLSALMGGEIGVRSTLGEGSEFWFTARLQLLQASVAPASAPEVQAPMPSPMLNTSVRILLAEDHPVNRMVVVGMLKRMGLSAPVVAENGQEALERAQEQAFDLVLMDIQMPVLDGLQATRLLREGGFQAPIIGLSAGALEEERQAALQAGANDYVLKPVQAHALRNAMERALLAAGPA